MIDAQHLLVVTATVDAAVETAWNDWYNGVHLPEIAACPGFRAAHRYVTDGPDGDRQYIAVYEIDGPEVLESPEFQARRGWGAFKDNVRFETRQYSRIAKIDE